MAATLSGQLKISGNLSPSDSVDLFANISAVLNFGVTVNMADGSGVNQFHQCIAKANPALAASGVDSWAMNDTVATDPYGTVLAVTKLKMLVVLNLGTTTINIGVTNGYAITGTAATVIPVAPGGAFVTFAPTANGFALQGANTGVITITNTSGAAIASYQLYAAGS